jgi:conjugative transfer signal peptidase TraF
MRRATLLGLAAAGAAALAAAALPRAPRLLWNDTASVPVGLYRVRAITHLRPGMLVVVIPPPAIARLMDARRYVPMGVPLIKPIAAVAGQRVCRHGANVEIDGRRAARALPHDRAGRPLPDWQGCRTLRASELFLLAPARADSFDSRYFGSVAAASLVGRATPLWIPGAR